MEESYSSFASVYDRFMDNVPYEEWCEYLIGLLRANGVSEGLVLDLGCGTGTLTELLASHGYDMIGIDMAPEMLRIAVDKKEQSGHDILYLQQDMREFELYGTVHAVVSICDSMNYILDEEELLQVFKLVNNYLDPGGIFVFDLNTPYKYKQMLADNVFAENREDCSFIWDNLYDEQEQINEYDLTLFVKDLGSGLYHRFEELHYQRAYELDLVKGLLEQSGMEFVGAYRAFTQEKPDETCDRVYMIAREVTK